MARTLGLIAPYTPLPKPSLIAKRLAAGTYQVTSIGLEKQCNSCTEFWPADTEFWFPQPGRATGLHYMCRACYAEWKAARTKAA